MGALLEVLDALSAPHGLLIFEEQLHLRVVGCFQIFEFRIFVIKLKHLFDVFLSYRRLAKPRALLVKFCDQNRNVVALQWLLVLEVIGQSKVLAVVLLSWALCAFWRCTERVSHLGANLHKRYFSVLIRELWSHFSLVTILKKAGGRRRGWRDHRAILALGFLTCRDQKAVSPRWFRFVSYFNISCFWRWFSWLSSFDLG